MLQLSLTQPSVRSYTASSPLRHDGIICILLNPATKRWLYAMALSFCLLMLIILSFVCCQRVLVGQWHDWPSCTIVLAAVSGRSAAGPPGPRMSQMFPEQFLQVGRLYRALILLGLTFCLLSASVPSVFMVLL